jgi:tRNA (cmo5U34)-methyltransferase
MNRFSTAKHNNNAAWQDAPEVIESTTNAGKTMEQERDELFAKTRAVTAGFRFDEQVVKVFPDMIARSVPGYELVVPMIGLLARRYAQDDSRIYDLGCSLGAASLAMARAVAQPGVEIIAVDNANAMIERLENLLQSDTGRTPVRAQLGDILEEPVKDASVVVLNFTLQFVERGRRQTLLQHIYDGMRADGALIISEKICFDDVGEQADQTDWHHDFKRTQGYSELEIARKRNALEKVLVPDSEAAHLKRMLAAGFRNARRWFQCFSFASFIAFK